MEGHGFDTIIIDNFSSFLENGANIPMGIFCIMRLLLHLLCLGYVAVGQTGSPEFKCHYESRVYVPL